VRSVFQQVVSSAVAERDRLALFLGDIGVYGFREVLRDYPSRAMNIGIMEQSMVSFAAGFARSGFRPVMHTIAPFLVERGLEQLKVDFGSNGLGGVAISVGAPFDYSKLGATHHCPGDLEIIGSIPTAVIKVPVSLTSLARHLKESLTGVGFHYLRLSEENVEDELELLGITPYGYERHKPGAESAVVIVGVPPKGLLDFLLATDKNLHILEDFRHVGLLVEQLIGLRVDVIEYAYEGSTARYFSSLETPVLFHGINREFIHDYGEISDLRKLNSLDVASLSQRLK